MRRLFSRKLLVLLVLVIIAALSGSTAYFYTRYQKAQRFLSNPNEVSKEEIKSITTALGKFMLLPKDDTPTIATILDKNKLKDQPFFDNTQNGDKMIIYTKSLKAILFRPSTGQVINFTTLNIGTSSAQTQQQPIRIAVYNGTNKVGLSQTFEKDIKAKVTNIEVDVKENAKKDNYEKTLVVDLSGNKADPAKQLAQLINGQVSKLPDGEVAPTSTVGPLDFLVILGQNYTGK